MKEEKDITQWFRFKLQPGWINVLEPDEFQTWTQENNINWDMLPIGYLMNPILVFETEEGLILFRLRFGL